LILPSIHYSYRPSKPIYLHYSRLGLFLVPPVKTKIPNSSPIRTDPFSKLTSTRNFHNHSPQDSNLASLFQLKENSPKNLLFKFSLPTNLSSQKLTSFPFSTPHSTSMLIHNQYVPATQEFFLNFSLRDILIYMI